MLIEISAVIAGGAGVSYWAGCKVDEWWQWKKADEAWLAHAEQCRRQAEADYIKEITEENERFRNEISKQLGRELSWIQERRTLNERCMFMAKEIMCDPDKKTQVMEPFRKEGK
jgi:hypothetical protein